MTMAAHTLSTRVPGQARPRRQRNARGTNVRARAGIFTSPLGVKTPDLRASLRTAPRPGTQVAGVAMRSPAHAISPGVIPALMLRTRYIRSPAGTRPSRDHGALPKLSWVPHVRPKPLRSAARPGKQVERVLHASEAAI